MPWTFDCKHVRSVRDLNVYLLHRRKLTYQCYTRKTQIYLFYVNNDYWKLQKKREVFFFISRRTYISSRNICWKQNVEWSDDIYFHLLRFDYNKLVFTISVSLLIFLASLGLFFLFSTSFPWLSLDYLMMQNDLEHWKIALHFYKYLLSFFPQFLFLIQQILMKWKQSLYW